MARPLSWIKGALLLREGDIGREGKGRGREGRGRGRRGGERKGGKEGRGGDPRVYL